MRSTYLLTILFAGLVTLTACGSAAARYNNEGNEAFEENNYPGALEDYTAAKQEDPDLAEPYYNSGNTYYRQGQYESAEMQTKQSIRSTERKENEALAQNSYYNLGNSYFQTQQWSEAIDAYKEALRLNPDDEDAKYNLELALKNQEQEQQQQQQQSGGGQPPQVNNHLIKATSKAINPTRAKMVIRTRRAVGASRSRMRMVNPAARTRTNLKTAVGSAV